MKAAKLVVAFAMLYAVTAAAPAGAAEFAYCDPLAPAGAALYPDADGASRAALGRGGVVREPKLAEVHSDLPASAKGRAAERFKTTSPGLLPRRDRRRGGERSSDAQIATQIDVLNRTFAGGEGGAATGFSFKLAGVTRTNNPSWFSAHGRGAHAHESSTGG